jgi:hypothetical protein
VNGARRDGPTPEKAISSRSLFLPRRPGLPVSDSHAPISIDRPLPGIIR